MIDSSEADVLRRRLGPPDDAHPLLESLDQTVSLGAGIHDPALGELLSRIVHDYVPQRINTLLRYRIENPGMEVAGVNLRSCVVYRGPGCSINLSFIDAVARNLHWHPYDAILCRVNPGTSRVHRYRLPDDLANDVVDPQARLDFVESQDFGTGSRLIKNADIDVFDFEASPGNPVLTARLDFPPSGSLEWTFDRQSLAPIGATSNNPAEGNLISLIKASAVFPESELGPLRQALLHSSHSVRWAAAQAIGKLDAQVALELLPGLTQDPHPHIRRAAERTLASLEH